MTTEFDLIARYFARAGAKRGDVAVGIGDDAALVTPGPGVVIVSACTALHEGIDFAPGTPAAELGRRAIEDGLRALAAHPASEARPQPAWALLGLTVPAADEDWTREFAAGLAEACRAAGVGLVGGDTTRGPRAVVCVLHALSPADG